MMLFPTELILAIFLLASAVAVARVRDLFAAAMLQSIFSLLSAGMLLLMEAVDVSFTEAAVGAGFSTVLILGTLRLTDSTEKPSVQHRLIGKLAVLGTGALLVYGTLDMPHYGDPNAPIHHHVAPDYIEGSRDLLDVPNVVTSVLGSYRSIDTFGEVTVVLTAAVGVALLLGGARSRHPRASAPDVGGQP
jgi:multicomponent Na+:H+ antiporter subunit B